MEPNGLIFDLDGTAVFNGREGMPSERLILAVKKAKNLLSVSIATGRTYDLFSPVAKRLQINTLCIISGGSQIVDPLSGAAIWKQPLTKEMVRESTGLLRTLHLDILYEDGFTMHRLEKAIPDDVEVCSIEVHIGPSEINNIQSRLSEISGITYHLFPSWTTGMFGVHITHELATKKHAMQALLAHINIDHNTVMVVGDGENDIPLFELAGLKVAMGNAADKLKAQADWIAPRVEEDGLAIAIEKFILRTTL